MVLTNKKTLWSLARLLLSHNGHDVSDNVEQQVVVHDYLVTWAMR